MADERRLIDANAYAYPGDLVSEPTVDAVEVVRCKYCCWRGSENCAMFYRCDCGEQHTWETDNDFCSYGERRCE